MSFKKLVQREIEVATSKDAQPAWFRIAKYAILVVIVYFFWGTTYLWIILLALFVLAMGVHFWYRYKTKGWTKSYGMWKHDSDKIDKAGSKKD